MITNTSLAYAAGFIDGEGCFYVGFRMGKNGRRCFPCTVTVSQTEDSVLSWMNFLFGGKFYPVKSSGKGKKQVWTWSIYGKEAESFVRSILPYLRIKKSQAEIFLKMRELINGNPMGKKITDSELAIRMSLVKSIKSAKSPTGLLN